MGYAMFNMREINLVSTISNLQYMITSLSMKQQQLAWTSSLFAMAGGQMNNQQQQANQRNLFVVQNQERMIEMQMKRFETQLQAKQKELESVTKAKEKAIQTATPKFGLN